MSGPFGGTHWMTSSKETIDWAGYRGVFAGGTSGNGNVAAGNTDSIGYVNLGAANADASDFGDLTSTRYSLMSVCNTARTVFIGGHGPPYYQNEMQYITTASLGDAQAFGTMDQGGNGSGHQISSGIRGVYGGYQRSFVNHSAEIDYITIDSTGNSTTFGNLDVPRAGPSGSSNGTRGLF